MVSVDLKISQLYSNKKGDFNRFMFLDSCTKSGVAFNDEMAIN